MAIDEREALQLAIDAALKSPCCKSKRGVVAWDARSASREKPVTGFNGPPPGFACDGTDACRAACGKLCVHAEIRALMLAPKDFTDLLHVKVRAGAPVPSGAPSCPDCSKSILDRGFKRVWLLHETGLRLYSAEDFHVQTLINCDLPLIRQPDGTDAPDPT